MMSPTRSAGLQLFIAGSMACSFNTEVVTFTTILPVGLELDLLFELERRVGQDVARRERRDHADGGLRVRVRPTHQSEANQSNDCSKRLSVHY
jgi:hypothetical protein